MKQHFIGSWLNQFGTTRDRPCMLGTAQAGHRTDVLMPIQCPENQDRQRTPARNLALRLLHAEDGYSRVQAAKTISPDHK